MEPMNFSYVNPVPIVCDLEQSKSPFFHQYIDRGRPSIRGVLYKLLEGMHGSNNDLASGNLVDDVLVQGLPRGRPLADAYGWQTKGPKP